MQYQRHRVIAALVLAPVDGNIHYVYRGGLVPLGVAQDRLDDWLSGKLIEAVDSGPVELPTAEQLVQQLAANGVTVTVEDAQAILDRQAATAEAAAADTSGTPSKDAKKEVWVAYAVAQGMDQAEAEKANKADLIAALTPA